MCIAVPVEVIEVKERQAVVDLEGITKEVNIDLINEVKVGDYVLLHSGCAIKKIDKEAAEKTLEVFERMRAAKFVRKRGEKKQ